MRRIKEKEKGAGIQMEDQNMMNHLLEKIETLEQNNEALSNRVIDVKADNQATLKKKKNKHKAASILLLLLLLVTGTFAMIQWDQSGFNPLYRETNFGGRLHDHFDGEGGGVHNKDIFAENLNFDLSSLIRVYPRFLKFNF